MEINRKALRSLFRGANYRYVAFEADGEPIGPGFAWVQRPIAEGRAASLGIGLYDTRDDEVIVRPDPEKRLVHWKEVGEVALEEHHDAVRKFESIVNAQRIEHSTAEPEEVSPDA